MYGIGEDGGDVLLSAARSLDPLIEREAELPAMPMRICTWRLVGPAAEGKRNSRQSSQGRKPCVYDRQDKATRRSTITAEQGVHKPRKVSI